MSSTSRGGQRMNDDWYKTPEWSTRAIIPHLRGGRRVLDPFAGKGAILDVAKASGRWSETVGIEIDSERAAICRTRGHSTAEADALRTTDHRGLDVSWAIRGQTVLTNCPYSMAMQCVERALREVGPDGEVAFLLRLAWLASDGRVDFHKAHPSDAYVLPKRPSFAASLKCIRPCGWTIIQEIDAPRPSLCPQCEFGKVRVTTSDSADYGWFVWGPARGNRWDILEIRDAS